jgi:enterochelin esterase-like enzyme
VSGDQVLAIDQLRSTLGTLSEEQREAAAASFFEQHALPVVEGRFCTFATRAAADGLYLRHRVNLWPDDLELEHIPGTDVWFLTIELEWGARVEYQFEIVRNGQRWRFNDSYNPRLARSPLGDCSVCSGPGYAVPDWAIFRAETDPGQLVDLQVHSSAQGRDNRVAVYLPARFEASTPYPLLVVHDGGDYLDYASMKIVLDNLIHDKKLAKLVVAFSHPGERLIEYPDDPDHAQWITRELLPRLEREFPLLAAPSGRCLMGTSFGAVAALSTAARFADTYGSLLLQSGSFLFSDPAVWHGESAAFDPVVRFIDRYRASPTRAVDRAFISCGGYEDLVAANRAMLPIFRSTGMKINYVESRDGHSWESWRDQLGPGLCWLFPGDGEGDAVPFDKLRAHQ